MSNLPLEKNSIAKSNLVGPVVNAFTWARCLPATCRVWPHRSFFYWRNVSFLVSISLPRKCKNIRPRYGWSGFCTGLASATLVQLMDDARRVPRRRLESHYRATACESECACNLHTLIIVALSLRAPRSFYEVRISTRVQPSAWNYPRSSPVRQEWRKSSFLRLCMLYRPTSRLLSTCQLKVWTILPSMRLMLGAHASSLTSRSWRVIWWQGGTFSLTPEHVGSGRRYRGGILFHLSLLREANSLLRDDTSALIAAIFGAWECKSLISWS